MTSYNGKCHCGQTAWTAKLPEATTILCHCDTCKLLSGGSYTLNQIIPKDDVKVTQGDLKAYVYKGDSGKGVNCYYCPNCTSHAYHVKEAMPDKAVIMTVLLDGGKDFKPVAEIYGKAKMSWEPESAQTFETMPPS
ncbi:hypothetical protein LTR66_013398 [Elasticomyces elasticus]|nr:hypothetical protein LTR66_013398 [Elasticomyces elasticus]